MRTTLTINSRGSITLLAKLRKALGLKADDQLIGETTPEGLLLRPAVTLTVEVYTPERVRELDQGRGRAGAGTSSPGQCLGDTAKPRLRPQANALTDPLR